MKKKFKLFNINPNSVWSKWWLWLIIFVAAAYLITGTVFAFAVYKYHKDGKATQIAVKVFPYPVAWVGMKPIWANQYYQQLGYVEKFSTKSNQPITDMNLIRSQIVDQMVQNALIEKEAKKYKIKVSKQDIDDAYKKLAEQNGGEDQVKKILNEMYGMNVKEFKNLVYDQLLREKVQQELLVQINAKHILIKDEAKAKEVLDRVKKGEKSFEDLAKEFSEDSGSKDNGGDLGWFGRGQMVKAFEDAAFSLQKDQVTQELIKTDFGYHIIKLVDKKGQIDKSLTDWLNELKAKLKIHIWLK
ncbi:MAG: peptidylprolyl isomerase [Patescibacteria group bacterium]|nr:peptidylprolyl isomerase [Patescibacteria group bacterium]